MNVKTLSLEQQREITKQRRFLAMPLAGMLIWAAMGMAAPYLDLVATTWMLYLGTGAIFYLGAGLSYLTGERFFSKARQNTTFDTLFFGGYAMAMCVFAIALPAASIAPETVPLSLGILTGLMWIPFSWIVERNVGYIHTGVRTVGILAVWYLFPDARVEAISTVIVVVYIGSIMALESRYHQQKTPLPALS